MTKDTIYIYSDASFSGLHGIAFIGWFIFKGDQEHNNLQVRNAKLNLLKIREVNNIRAEIRSVITSLQDLKKDSNILLYTDCQAICGLISRRSKLEQSNFISKSKNQALANADLYKEFFSIYDKYNLTLHWVKGHSAGKNLSRVQKTFSYLDKQVRKMLRAEISDVKM
jgi:ribonuclease HI